MNKEEYDFIYNNIIDIMGKRNGILTYGEINKQISIKKELLEWANNNGGCILLKEETKKLKTKDKHICIYMAKWGIKFQITEEIRYHKVVSIRFKMLTKNKFD